MKKVINKPQDLVTEMIDGLVGMNAGLARLADLNVVLRADIEQVRDREVTIVSGGGSGHEPAHAGFVGQGMLTAAVAGEVFTSPSVDSVVAAIRAVAGTCGVLLIVKNYTGDRLNFGLAAEMARAEGISVEMVLIADDIALALTQAPAERRGLAGTVLVHKIAGAAAAKGLSLELVKEAAQSAAEAVSTIGLSLSAGTNPAVGTPGFMLNDDEAELGLGIHGEPGVRRIPLSTADEHATQLIELILESSGFEAGASIAVLVNNLGATTAMEMNIFTGAVLQTLRNKSGFVIERVYVNTFVSSLDAAGCSVSVMQLTPERLAMLDDDTTAAGWPRSINERPSDIGERTIAVSSSSIGESKSTGGAQAPALFRSAVLNACQAIIDAERELTELDQAVGDGDIGVNLSRGAKAVQLVIGKHAGDVPDALRAIGQTMQRVVGGTSGPLYAVFFLRMADTLDRYQVDGPEQWSNAFAAGCDAMRRLGGAQLGDRTMLDALIPFSETLKESLFEKKSMTESLKFAEQAARQGAEATAAMIPKRGRSSYLQERALQHKDPGAAAVSILLSEIVKSIEGK